MSRASLRQAAVYRRDFGNRVRALREEAGISQEELARRAGLHRTYMGSVERGERNISLANIHAIADALEVPVAALFPEPGDRSREEP